MARALQMAKSRMVNGTLHSAQEPAAESVPGQSVLAALNPERSRLLVLGGLFLLLCWAYGLATPLFEAPDERDHFSHANWLADGNGLPHIIKDQQSLGEIWQPPLYYALLAAAIAPVDRSDFATTAPLSDDWLAGRSRLAHYHYAGEAFPFRSTALAVHLARAVTSLLGLITVLATYGIARRAVPGYALVAAALVALNPQFIFISSAINNDNLVIALCSVALWLLVRELTRPVTAGETQPGVWWFIAVGLVWGLATLSKLTGATLGVVIGLAVLALTVSHRSWRPLLLGGLVTGGTAALVCGWWFWRNWRLYGDPLAWDEMLLVTTGLLRPALLSWPEALSYATFLRKSYWAMFGYGIEAPASFYLMVYGLVAVAVAGLCVAAVRFVRGVRASGWPTGASRQRLVAVGLLAVWGLTVLVFLLRWMRQIEATNQGRLLYPAAAALAVLLALGLRKLDGRRHRLAMAATVIMGCWAAAMPMLVLRPAFAQPAAIPAAAVLPNPVEIRFGEAITLRGYELPSEIVPGEPVSVALYWQTSEPLSDSYVVAARILDAAGRPASGLDSLPAGGRYPTLVWPPGVTFRDTLLLPPVSPDATPGPGRLLVTLYPGGDADALLPASTGGTEAWLGAIKIPAAEPVTFTPEHAISASFDGRFALLGYDLPETAASGEQLPITLLWQATQPDGRDYTVFLHLLDESGALVTQADGQPRDGRYPTTIWAAGEQIVDERLAPIPADIAAERLTVLAGLYDAATGARLPVFAGDGARYLNDAVPLGTMRVTP